MHTKVCQNGARFFYNSDLSGNLVISKNEIDIMIPWEDIIQILEDRQDSMPAINTETQNASHEVIGKGTKIYAVPFSASSIMGPA